MTTLPEHPDFERLEFAFGKIGRPQVDHRSIRVRVRHIWVYKGFPGYDQEKLYKEATLVFEDVVSSERELALYIPRKGELSGITETIVDGPFDEVTKPVFSIYWGGLSYDPEAWVEWNMVAASVRVEDGIESVEQQRPPNDFDLRSYHHHGIFASLVTALNSVIKRGFQGK